MAYQINGRKIAKRTNNVTKNMVSHLDYVPFLAIILVHSSNLSMDKANQLYVHMKARQAKKLGIKSKIFLYPQSINQTDILSKIESLNQNPDIDGILVQLPLPKQLNVEKVEALISPSKDVDGVNPTNVGKLAMKSSDNYPTSCTPTGIITMLNSYALRNYKDSSNIQQQKILNKFYAGKKAVIVGSSNMVGRPLAFMLINHGCEVSILNHLSNNHILDQYTKVADIIISNMGHIDTIKAHDISNHAILVDTGENHNPKTHKLCGDISKEAKHKSLAYTPVPGGVGCNCISTLMRHVVLASQGKYLAKFN